MKTPFDIFIKNKLVAKTVVKKSSIDDQLVKRTISCYVPAFNSEEVLCDTESVKIAQEMSF